MGSILTKSVAMLLALATSQYAFSGEPIPSNAQLQAAQRAVKPLFEKMIREEKSVETAYRDKDRVSLARLAAIFVKGAPGIKSWDPSEYSPYVKCDTAWIDLGLYASALEKEVSSPTPTMRKIVQDELADYQRSKSFCQQRLSLPPQQAWQQYVRE